MVLDIYENGFIEFLEEAASAEKRNRFRVAVSNYYKALTELYTYLIIKKLDKIPNNHTEIFLFLKTSFPEIHAKADLAFSMYKKSYNSICTIEDCEIIKNAIKETLKNQEFGESIKKSAEKI